MGLTSSNQATRPTSSLPIVGKGQYDVGCADLMVAAENDNDCGLFARIFYPASLSHDSREEPVQYPLWKPRAEYLNGLAEYRQMHPRKMHFFFDWIVGERRIPASWAEPLYSHRLERTNVHNLNTSLHGSQSAVQLSEISEDERLPHSHSAQCLEEDLDDPKFPVLIFSHGISGNRICYSTLCASLASYGYVVVAIEHRDRSASWSFTLETDPISGVIIERPITMTTYPDGEAEFKQRNRQLHYRVGECLRAFSVMEELNAGIAGPIDRKLTGSKIIYGYDFDWSQFKGRLDMEKAAMVGHSFGASAAIAAAAFSTDFSTAISLDGWLYPIETDLYSRVTQSTLFLNASKWQWPENVKRMYHLENQTLFTFKDIVHQSFSDFAYLMPGYVGRKFSLQGELDPTFTGEAILEIVVAHLRRCFGQDGPEPREVAARYKEFVFEGTDLDTSLTTPPPWNPNAPPPDLSHLKNEKAELNGTQTNSSSAPV
ncbi:1-alkyl-2-acetylglycerophosphocholine esterase [Aphelenchoides besseyi]|nr:1-alkyl-2-acetylglycerophosphocholine esterase [Aphelenchoides besseyi]